MTININLWNPVFVFPTDPGVRRGLARLEAKTENLMSLATEISDRVHSAESKVDAAKVVLDDVRARLADATENGMTRDQAIAIVDELDQHVAALDASANPPAAPVVDPAVA